MTDLKLPVAKADVPPAIPPTTVSTARAHQRGARPSRRCRARAWWCG